MYVTQYHDIVIFEVGNNMREVLVIGIILLFVGIAFQPAVAVTPKTTVNDDDCNLCPKVSNLKNNKTGGVFRPICSILNILVLKLIDRFWYIYKIIFTSELGQTATDLLIKILENIYTVRVFIYLCILTFLKCDIQYYYL